MTDLRDHLADFDALARRVLERPPPRPAVSRGLCGRCYRIAWKSGELPPQRDYRRRLEFVADYELLRSEGYTRRQIAERLAMTYDAVTQAYHRAVRAGALTPDRRAA